MRRFFFARKQPFGEMKNMLVFFSTILVTERVTGRIRPGRTKHQNYVHLFITFHTLFTCGYNTLVDVWMEWSRASYVRTWTDWLSRLRTREFVIGEPRRFRLWMTPGWFADSYRQLLVIYFIMTFYGSFSPLYLFYEGIKSLINKSEKNIEITKTTRFERIWSLVTVLSTPYTQSEKGLAHTGPASFV